VRWRFASWLVAQHKGEAPVLVDGFNGGGSTSGGWQRRAETAGGGVQSRGDGGCMEAKWKQRTLPLGAGAGRRPHPHVSAVSTGADAQPCVGAVTVQRPAKRWAEAGPGTGRPS
jgi:hypothetical protein